jgi:hypothetical protein
MDEAGHTHESPRYLGASGESVAPPTGPIGIIVGVSSPLSEIDVDKRRQVAATLGLFAMLFIAVGAVAGTGADTAVIKVFVGIALLIALVLGLLAWGVLRSIKLDLEAQQLDATIDAAVRASGGWSCDCGHDHDPTEMHVVDSDESDGGATVCSHDGTGRDCAHSCDTCVLAAMRPSPSRTRADRMHSA